jgi:hypothetical protein
MPEYVVLRKAAAITSGLRIERFAARATAIPQIAAPGVEIVSAKMGGGLQSMSGSRLGRQWKKQPIHKPVPESSEPDRCRGTARSLSSGHPCDVGSLSNGRRILRNVGVTDPVTVIASALRRIRPACSQAFSRRLVRILFQPHERPSLAALTATRPSGWERSQVSASRSSRGIHSNTGRQSGSSCSI